MKSKIATLLALFAVLLIIVSTSSCDPQVTPPKQGISYEEANTLEEDYIQTRYNVINAALGYQDTREFWFSLDSLKRYIEYVEYEARNKDVKNLGIRIYFAAYPQNSTYPDAGYSTVFLVPTAQKDRSQVRQSFAPIQPIHENIEGILALNYSQGGQPPTDY
jgi:hypothetical protein